MRDRLQILEQDLAEARERAGEADGLEAELVERKRAIERLEHELAKHGTPPTPGRNLAKAAGATVVLGVIGAGLGLYRTGTPPLPTPVATATAIAPTPVEPPSATAVAPPAKGPRFSLHRAAIFPAPVESDAPLGMVAVTFDDGKDRHYFATALADDGARRLWTAGPYEGDADHLLTAIVGARAVIADGRAQAHLLDVTTGRELAVFPLGDVAARVCAHGPEVWIATVDGKGMSIDVATAKAQSGQRPTWCTVLDARAAAACTGPTAACAAGSTAPIDAGIRADAVLRDGNDAIAIGIKNPGTETPMAYGFDPRSRAIIWRSALPADPALAQQTYAGLRVDLASGILVAAYDLRAGGGRVTALDARTGARLWDVPLPGDEKPPALSVTATKTRAYVTQWARLHVFELSTGRHLATQGGF